MFFINSRNKKINDKFLTLIKLTLTILYKYWHSVNLFYSKTYTRGVFRTHPIITIKLFAQQTFLVFQDVFKTSWRRLQRDTFHLPRRLQDVFKSSSKTSSRRVCKTSCNYVFKTSWKTKKCYTEDVFTKTNVCWVWFSQRCPTTDVLLGSKYVSA